MSGIRHARIDCEGNRPCGEWNCDYCHPFPMQPVADAQGETAQGEEVHKAKSDCCDCGHNRWLHKEQPDGYGRTPCSICTCLRCVAPSMYATNETKMPCDCWKHEYQVCDICQGVTGPDIEPSQQENAPQPQQEKEACPTCGDTGTGCNQFGCWMNAPQPQQEELEVGTCSSLDVPHPYCHVGSWRPIVQRCEHGIRPPHECRDCFYGSVKAISSQPQPAESGGFLLWWKTYLETHDLPELPQCAIDAICDAYNSSRQSLLAELDHTDGWLMKHPRPSPFHADEAAKDYIYKLEDRIRWLNTGISCSRSDRAGFMQRAEAAEAKLSSLLAQKPEAMVSEPPEEAWKRGYVAGAHYMALECGKELIGILPEPYTYNGEKVRQLFKDAEKGMR